MIVNFLVVSAVVLLLILKLMEKKKAPPYAAGALPIIGHTILFLKNRDRLYDILLEKMLGTVLREGKETATIQCGTWKIHVLMDPDDGLALSNSCLEKDVIYNFFTPLFGHGLVNSVVPTWRKHRKLLNPTFSQSVIDQYLIEFNRGARYLVKYIAQEEGKGRFDQTPYVKYATFHSIMATALGSNANDQHTFEYATNVVKYYEAFTEIMTERTRKFWYHSDFLYGLSNLKKKENQLSKNYNDIAKKVIQKNKEGYEARKQSFKHDDYSIPKSRYRGFIDRLLDSLEDGALTEEEVLDEVKTFILAGSDTSALAVSLTLLLIGSYPEIQEKVYEELLQVYEGTERDVEKQDFPKLKYLDAVLKETMRLYPTVIGVGRHTDKDIQLKNYVIPAGSSCYVSIYNICRHPMWGEDVNQFRPERWLDPNTLPANHNAFAAFGLGKRNCIGLQYATISMKTMLIHMLRRYKVSGDVTKLVRRIDVIVRMVSGHQISIERRTPVES